MGNLKENFITCRLMGGLGNTLFQISAAYSISLRDNKNFICKLSENSTTHTPYHEYINNIFRNIKFVNEDKIYENYYDGTYHIGEETFLPDYREIPIFEGNLKLHGYFLCEKYFNLFRSEILDLFKIDILTYKKLKFKYSDFINDENTCSIHIRRGDFLKKKDHHLVLGIDYFIQSYNLMGHDKKYLIFSDDIEWCKENLMFIKNKIFVENNKDYEDLYLMSLCKNNIISNSTFSWWGAWLNEHPGKKIIGPRIWYGEKLIQNKIEDFFCENWIII